MALEKACRAKHFDYRKGVHETPAKAVVLEMATKDISSKRKIIVEAQQAV